MRENHTLQADPADLPTLRRRNPAQREPTGEREHLQPPPSRLHRPPAEHHPEGQDAG